VAFLFNVVGGGHSLHGQGQCAAPIAEGTAVEPEGARAGAVNRVKRKNATPPHARSSGGRSLLGHSGEEVQSAVPNAMVSGSIVCCGEEQGMPRRRRTWWSTGHSLHAWSRAVRFSIIQMPRAAENRSRELRYARFRRVKSQKGRPPVREKLRGTLPAGPLWREVKRVAPNACARWAEMTGRFWKKRRSQTCEQHRPCVWKPTAEPGTNRTFKTRVRAKPSSLRRPG